MNESRTSGKCDCLDDDPRKCYELKLLKIGKKVKDSHTQYLCPCQCHADYLEGDTDQIKGGC
jgi:hypothetical protein